MDRTFGAPLLALALLGAPPARAATSFSGQRFYFGDPHAHTGASGDGWATDMGRDCTKVEGAQPPCGAVADLVATARANGLDFLAVTDHVNGPHRADPADFEQILEQVMAGHDPAGGFVTIPAGELWLAPHGKVGGHVGLYLFAENEALSDLRYEDFAFRMIEDTPTESVKSCGELWAWAEALEQRFGPVLVLPHHPQAADAMTTEWACHSRAFPQARHFAPAVEIYSRHGNSSLFEPAYDPLWASAEEDHSLPTALDPHGWALPLGLLGGTDSHDTNPGAVCGATGSYTKMPYGGGLTALVLPEDEPFDRGAVAEAIQRRATYATSGPQLPVLLDYTVDGERLGGMGETLRVPAGATLAVALSVPSEHDATVQAVLLRTPTEEIDLVRVEPGRFAASIPAAQRPAWAYAVVLLDGARWYQKGCNDGGEDTQERLWLSPTWFRDEAQPDTGSPDTPPGPPGCGCASGNPGSLGAMPLLLLALRRRARPRPSAAHRQGLRSNRH